MIKNLIYKNLKEKNWKTFPKFRHNLLTTYEENPNLTYMTISDGTFEVSTNEAHDFLKIRTFCTGNHSRQEIAEKSQMPIEKVNDILTSLFESEFFRHKAKSFSNYSQDDLRTMLFTVTEMWAKQLEETYIATSLSQGKETYSTLIGWLLETYHYLKEFPNVIKAGIIKADKNLKKVLVKYANQEQGHERYISEILIKLGFKKNEIENSIPLVSTKLILNFMKDLIFNLPESCLLIAKMIEVESDDEQNLNFLAKNLEQQYQLPADSCRGLTKHAIIDFLAGHGKLAAHHRELINIPNRKTMDYLVNSLHDIKHAFDLQALEIRDYYNKPGNYIPRQFVDMYSI